MPAARAPKRFAAIVLPDLACELARAQALVGTSQPFALIVGERTQPGQAVESNERLAAVDARAFRYGVRPAQRVGEAAAFIGNLQLARLAHAELNAARALIAELALGYGTTAALALERPRARGGRHKPPGSRSASGARQRPVLGYPLGAGAGPLDTVWLDISGCAQLHGGEAALCEELGARIGVLGHRARIAVAGGPRVAQAVARWCPQRCSQAGEAAEALIVAPGQEAARLAALPTAALPLDLDQLTWLSKLGVLRVAELRRLDRPRLAHRLGPGAQDLLLLLEGQDQVPLCAYQPPDDICEQAVFDEPITKSEPLMFVLRGLIARTIARLDLRGLACRSARLTLRFDPGVVALAGREASMADPPIPEQQSLQLTLPVPLSREEALRRALQAKLEGVALPAPVVDVQLALEQLSERPGHQIPLGHRGEPEPTALPILLAELSALLGPQRVGTLQLVDSHQPEKRSRLVPVTRFDGKPTADKATAPGHSNLVGRPSPRWQLPAPSRVLQHPVEVKALREGALIATTGTLYTIDHLHLLGRIDQGHWWTEQPICRDYARGLLRTSAAVPSRNAAPLRPRSGGPQRTITTLNEAWVYLDRLNGRSYLHGWFD